MNPNNEAERARQKKKKFMACAAAVAAATVAAAYVTDYAESSGFQPPKKTKRVDSKIISPLKQMASALKAMAADSEDDFARAVNEAVDGMFGCDEQGAHLASCYLIHHRPEAKLILTVPKEKRLRKLEQFMNTSFS